MALDEVLNRWPEWEVDWDNAEQAHTATRPGLGEAAGHHRLGGADTMQMDDMILVSIDDHMIEPPDMYENHVPAKWKDEVPKVVRNDARRRRVGVPGRERPRRRSAWPPPSAGRGRSGASTPARTPSCGPAASTCTSGCAT